jgi:hypothetical protein
LSQQHLRRALAWPCIAVALLALGYASACTLTALAQSVPPEEFVGPFPSWRQVQCTGGDDTAMLQAELNNLDGEHQRPVLFIKPGTCRIASTLALSNKLYVTILGADPSTTKMLWAGPGGGRMFQTDGVSYSRFGRLTWDGGGTAHVVYDLTYGTAFSSGNRHEDEVFQNLAPDAIAIRGGENGIGDAETEFVRCRFLGPYAVGILLKNFNTLDYWVWDSEFRNLGVGVGNNSDVEFGAGGFSVNRSIFINNTYDMRIANTNFFSARWNYSRGAGRHLFGDQIGSSAAPWTSQGETIIDPQGNPSSTQEYMGNVGPLLMIDTMLRMPGYVLGQNGLGGVSEGFSGNPTGDVAALHNTFSANSNGQYGIPAAGRSHIVWPDDVINATIADPNPSIPPVPPASTRPVIEVQNQDIAAALAQAGNSPVIVHMVAGTYNVSSTLEVGPNVILTGDGHVATRLNSTGANPILHLAGPSHAILRDFSFFGDWQGARFADGIVIDNADQSGGLVHSEDWHNHRSIVGVDVQNLGQTVVDTLDSQEGSDQFKDGGKPGDPPFLNYRATNAKLHIFNGAGSGSDQMYDVRGGGELVSQTVYFENDGGATNVLVPNGSGTLVMDAGRWSANPGSLDTSTFNGNLTITNYAIANPGFTTKLGANTFVMGFVFGWNTDPGCPTFAGSPYAFWFGRHNTGTGGTDLSACSAESSVGVSDPDQFMRDHLAPLRAAKPLSLSSRPANVTDVRLYRVGGELMRTGLRVQGSAGPPPPTATPTPQGAPTATPTFTPVPNATSTPTPVPAATSTQTAPPTSTPVLAGTSTPIPQSPCQVLTRHWDATLNPPRYVQVWIDKPASFCRPG